MDRWVGKHSSDKIRRMFTHPCRNLRAPIKMSSIRPYFVKRQVTCGIGCPDVSVNRLRSDATPTANGVIIALTAATLEHLALLPHADKELVFLIVPYFAELPLPDVSQGHVLPELTWMDVAKWVHIAALGSGRTAAVDLRGGTASKLTTAVAIGRPRNAKIGVL